MSDVEKKIMELCKIVHHIPVEEVMSKPPKTINVNDELSAVEEMFVSEKIHHLPVVNSKKEVIGLISQRDIHRRISPRRAQNGSIMYRKDIIIDEDGYYEKESLDRYILNYVMKQDPTLATKEKTLGDVIRIMVDEKVGCVPIVDEKKKAIGVITRFDILKLAVKFS